MMIELRWMLPADNDGRRELHRLRDIAGQLTLAGIIEPRPHGPFIAVHARVATPEDGAKLAVISDDALKRLADKGPGLELVKTYWFRCEIPEDRTQARRIEWARDIAMSLGSVREVHFSTATTAGATLCDVRYSGEEAPRIVLTKLYLATGESFHLYKTWTTTRASSVATAAVTTEAEP
jgi:hypothetical protein